MAQARPQRSILLLTGIIASVLIGWVLHVGADIIQPIVIALLLASMLQPVVVALAKRHIPPPVTVILLTALLFFVLLQVGILFEANVRSFLGIDQPPPVSRPAVDDELVGEGSDLDLSLPEGDLDPDAASLDGAPGDGVPGDGDPGTGADGGSSDGAGEGAVPGGDAGAQEPRSGDPAGATDDPDLATGDGPADAQDGEGSDGEADGAGSEDGDPQEGAEETAPRLDPFDTQNQAIEQVGGWEGIVVRISERIQSAEHLPQEIRDYACQALANFNLRATAEDLALTGYGFAKTLVLVLIYMVFIFAEQAVFRRKILSVAGGHESEAAEILDRIGRGIQRYLGVKTVVSFLTGALCYLVLVALDIPYALLFGFVTFLLNYIPTFGSIIAGAFPFVTALAVEASLVKALVVLATYLSVNLTLGSFIEPRILGRELNLSPLVVVISVVVWAGLWGIVGGFLAVPLTAALQIILASNDTTFPIAVMLGSGPARRRRPPGEGAGPGDRFEAA